jgi:hypothetical protein
MLAQGSVNIAGLLEASARYEAPNLERTPGPGGFFGGFLNANGFGPGAGQNSGNRNAQWVGPLALVPIVGGSGGAGSNCVGRGGGGAILIASSGSIQVSGAIQAFGNHAGICSIGYGSGGAIRLVANAANVTGTLNASGAQNNPGVVRVEAPPGALTFTGSSYPAAVLSAVNPKLTLSATPALRLLSIGGFSIPAGSGARSDTVDLLLPSQLVDPIPLVVQASNIPVGSKVTVAINGSPSASATPGTLAGTDESSTATVNISSLDRTKVIFVFASVTFEVPHLAQAGNVSGPDQVAKLRVGVAPGKQSTVAFLRQDGTEVALNHVPPTLRQLFGQ